MIPPERKLNRKSPLIPKPGIDWKLGMQCLIKVLDDQPLPVPLIGFVTGDQFSPGGMAGHYEVTIPSLVHDEDGRAIKIRYLRFQVPEENLHDPHPDNYPDSCVVDHINDLDFMIMQ